MKTRPGAPPGPWADEDFTNEVLRLWKAGKSGGKIAQMMGLTRSSVMGKLNRLGVLNADRAVVDRFPANKFKPGQSKPMPRTWSDQALTETWAERKKRRANEQRHQR